MEGDLKMSTSMELSATSGLESPTLIEPILSRDELLMEIPSTPSSSATSPTPATTLKANQSHCKQEHSYDFSPMFFDPNLPAGWTRRVTQRTMGASAGKYDVYIFSPDKKKIRSKTDLMLYLAKNKLDLNPNDFDFSVRGRSKMNIKKTNTPKRSNPSIPNKNSTTSVTTKISSIEHKRSKISNVAVNRSDSLSEPASSSHGGPKLVVKFNFPVPRFRRTHSKKSKKKSRKKIKKQVSQSLGDEQVNCDSTISHTDANYDVNENSVPTTNLKEMYCDNDIFM